MSNNKFDDFYNTNINLIEKFYLKYGFCCSTKSEFYELCKKIILKIYQEGKTMALESCLLIAFKNYTANLFKNSSQEEKLSLIFEYCKQNMNYTDNYKSDYNQIKKFTKFFLDNGVHFDIDLSLLLLSKVSSISNTIVDILEKEITTIKNHDISDLYNENLCSLIEAYASQNDIQLTDDNIEDLFEEFVKANNTDGVKMYLKEVGKYSMLNPSEERELLLKYKKGDSLAKDKLIQSNLRLVVSVAKKHQNRGLDFLDLIQEGTLGLMTAIEKFDVDKGTKLSTYATWWIKQAITRSIGDKGRNIRIPIHVIEKLGKINAYKLKYEKQNGIEPTIEEIAKEFKMSVSAVNQLLLKTRDTTSLNQTIDDDKESELENFIGDERVEVEAHVDNAEERKHILAILKESLTEKEYEIIMMRFGFYNDTPLTLEECGRKYHVTRERVRQLEAKALRKLSHPKTQKKLIGYNPQNYTSESENTSVKNSNPKEYIYFKNKIDTTVVDEENKTNRIVIDDFFNEKELNVIGEYFLCYSTKEIVDALKTLSKRELEMLKSKVIDDIRGTTTLSSLAECTIKQDIFPKLSSALNITQTSGISNVDINEVEDNDYTEFNQTELKQLNLYFSQYSIKEITNVLGQLNDTSLKLIHKKLQDNIENDITILTLKEQDDISDIFDDIRKKLDESSIKTSNTQNIVKRTIPQQFRESLKEYSFEQIKTAVSGLTENDYSIILTLFSATQQGNIDDSNTQEHEKRYNNIILPTLKRWLANEEVVSETKEDSINIPDIYKSYFKYTRCEINKALLALDITYFNILKKITSTEYNNKVSVPLSSYERSILDRKIIPQLNLKLKQFYKERIRNVANAQALNVSYKCCANLYTFFNEYTEDEINLALKTINLLEYDILKKKFGNDFKIPTLNILSIEDTVALYTEIIPKIKAQLQKIRSIPSEEGKIYFSFTNIYTYFSDYTKEQIDNILLKLENSEIEILKEWFGEDFENPLLSKLSEDKIFILHGTILLKINHLLEQTYPDVKNNKNKDSASFHNIYIYFSKYTKQEIGYALRCLKDSEYNIILKKLNNSFTNHTLRTLTKNESHTLFAITLLKIKNDIEKNRKKSLNNTETVHFSRFTTIYDYFNIYSKIDINNAIEHLSKSQQNQLREIFNNNFEKPIEIATNSKEMLFLYSEILPSIKKILDKDIVIIPPEKPAQNSRSLYSYFKHTKKQVDDAIKKLSKEEYYLLRKRFSYDFENPILTPLSKEETDKIQRGIIPKIKKIIKETEDQMKEQNTPKKENKKGRKSLDNIYEYFNMYTKEQIDEAIKQLKSAEYDVLVSKYGEDFENPVLTELSPKDKSKFYNTIIPKIKKHLFANFASQNNSTGNSDTLADDDIEENNKNSAEEIQIANNKNPKEDYINAVQTIKTPLLEQLIKSFPAEISVILNLKFGYIMGKYYTSAEIAEFLGMEEQKVKSIIKAALAMYKTELINAIDNSINVIIEDGYQYTKLPKE